MPDPQTDRPRRGGRGGRGGRGERRGRGAAVSVPTDPDQLADVLRKLGVQSFGRGGRGRGGRGGRGCRGGREDSKSVMGVSVGIGKSRLAESWAAHAA